VLCLIPFAVYLVDLATRVKHKEHPPSQSVVLVTGASRGVGLGLSLHLASKGVMVVAGVRSPADLGVFAKTPNIHPLLLDVTSQDHLNRAHNEIAKLLQSTGKSFAGVVANAAMLSHTPAEYEADETEQRLFDINYFGVVRLIRKLFPLLVAQNSRIIIVGSAGALVPVPFLSTYVASKAALLSYSNSLRAEIEHMGVAVTYISLGSVKTDMLVNSKSTTEFAGTPYAALETEMVYVRRQVENLESNITDIVVELSDPIFNPYPPCIVHLGLDAKLSFWNSLLPQRILQTMVTKAWFH